MRVANTLTGDSGTNHVNPGNKFTWAWLLGDNIVKLSHGRGCKDLLIFQLAQLKTTGTIYHGDRVAIPSTNSDDLLLYSSWPTESTGDNAAASISVKNTATNLEFLNSIERELGLTPTELLEVGDHNIMFKGNPFWKQTTLHASIWVDHIRNCHKPNKIVDWKSATDASSYVGYSLAFHYVYWIDSMGYSRVSLDRTLLWFKDVWPLIPSVLPKLQIGHINADKAGSTSYMGYWGALKHFFTNAKIVPDPVSWYGHQLCSLLLEELKKKGVNVDGITAR